MRLYELKAWWTVTHDHAETRMTYNQKDGNDDFQSKDIESYYCLKNYQRIIFCQFFFAVLLNSRSLLLGLHH